MAWPVIAAAGIGAASSALGQRSANRTNVKLAREQMSFQERMSSTAWQRGMADMRKAGVNPMLTIMQGGASSPVGASTTVGNVGESATAGASSAVSSSLMKRQRDLVGEQVGVEKARAREARAAADIKDIERWFEQARMGFYFHGNGLPKDALRELLRSEHGAKIATSARSVSEADLARLSIPERKALSTLWERAGSGGKGVQLTLPLLMSIIRSRN